MKSIDREVAEKILGWEYHDDFRPTQNMGAAWQVVEKATTFSLEYNVFGYWTAVWNHVSATDLEAPKAICLAALKAVSKVRKG